MLPSPTEMLAFAPTTSVMIAWVILLTPVWGIFRVVLRSTLIPFFRGRPFFEALTPLPESGKPNACWGIEDPGGGMNSQARVVWCALYRHQGNAPQTSEPPTSHETTPFLAGSLSPGLL